MNITILIPLYNGINYLENCLNSVYKQTYTNWEIIIGLNGHFNDIEIKKQIKKIVNKNKKVKIFNFNFQSKVKTLNELVKKSHYDLICILDVDDFWHPKKLETQINVLKQNPNIDIIGTFCHYIDINNNILSFKPNLPSGYITNFINFNPIINSSVILKKENAKWYEETDENLKLFGIEDYYLWLKLKLENKIFFNINLPLVYHRLHSESFFNNKNNDLSSLDIIKEKLKNI